MMFTKFSGRTDSRTHSLTDWQTRIQYASGTVFQRCRRHENVTAATLKKLIFELHLLRDARMDYFLHDVSAGLMYVHEI